jgi:hypothetical protein
MIESSFERWLRSVLRTDFDELCLFKKLGCGVHDAVKKKERERSRAELLKRQADASSPQSQCNWLGQSLCTIKSAWRGEIRKRNAHLLEIRAPDVQPHAI